MKVLFGSLSNPQTEQYKLYIIQMNLSPKYANATAPLLIRSLDDLSETCKRIDDLSSGLTVQAANLPFEKRNHSQRQMNNWNRQKDNNGFNNRSPRVYELETGGSDETRNKETSDEIDEVLAVELDKQYKKLLSNGCWNCGQRGHSFSQCPEPRERVFCFRCGKPNVTTAQCNNCSGNEQRNSFSQGGKVNSGVWSKNPHH